MFSYTRKDTPLSARVIAHNINLTTPTRLPAPVRLLQGVFVGCAIILALVIIAVGLAS